MSTPVVFGTVMLHKDGGGLKLKAHNMMIIPRLSNHSTFSVIKELTLPITWLRIHLEQRMASKAVVAFSASLMDMCCKLRALRNGTL